MSRPIPSVGPGPCRTCGVIIPGSEDNPPPAEKICSNDSDARNDEPMRLTELLEESGLQVSACKGDAEITSVQADSRRCTPNSCFVAVQGSARDGHDFIRLALSAGAAAIVCENSSRLPADGSIPHAVVRDSHEALGRLAQGLKGFPGRKLTCIGVTGTNGKTTVTHLIRSILSDAGHRTALVGTISYETGRRSISAGMTTPDAVELAEMMGEMVDSGVTHLVMEVSSHALDQRRTAGVEFDVGVFTNLSGDHLDYHHTMDEYLAAKMRLFESLTPTATAIINRDDPRAELVASSTAAKVHWYGLGPLSEIQGRIERIDAEGTVFDLITSEERLSVHTPLTGRHNVFNCLAAAGASQVLGVDLKHIAKSLQAVDRIAGRLERVPTTGGYQVFVDYAHTDDALRNVISSLRPITRGRVIVVFGCGGDRDKTKRPRMGRIAQDLADHIVITSDNPRTENPQQIIEDILTGLDVTGLAKSAVEPDRRKAIHQGIELARDGDVVLIAGKGHESYQVVGGRKKHFDDVEVAEECIRLRSGAEEREV